MRDSHMFAIVFTGIWCLVGAIFLGVGIGLRRSFNRRDERLRARTNGTVTEIVRRGSGDTSSFYPIVDFEYEGRTISLEADTGGGRKRHYVGQSVEVLYDPDDPTCFRLEGDGGVGIAGSIMLAVGFGCVAIGVVAGLLASGIPFKYL